MQSPDYENIIYNLTNEMASIRDRLRIIVDGTIQKGRNSSQYSIGPEFRKVNLKDAKEICGYAIGRINRAINKADEEAHPERKDFLK